MRSLGEWLREPELDGMTIDGPSRLQKHRVVLERKRMIGEVFRECHRLLRHLEIEHLSGDGIALEVGAGVAPVRDTYNDVLSTDIVAAPHLDFVTDAQQLCLRSASVRVIYAQNAFHHFPEPERFLAELQRVASPGGGAVLLEPYHGIAASWLYRRLFRTEGFDKEGGWTTSSTGPMSGANQALSYIVFVRDRARFEKSFPLLRVVHQAPLENHVRYLLAGGLNFRQLVPDAGIPALKAAEWLLRPLRRVLALHHVIVIRRERP